MPHPLPTRWPLVRLISAALGCGLTLGAAAGAQAPAAAATPGAEDALAQAHALHRQLEAKPAGERAPADYQAIVALLEPLWASPGDADADAARFEAAGVYVAQARDLGDAAAYTQAAAVYLALLRASPYTGYRRNAEWALAQIQIFHQHEARAAAVWLRDFVQRYPADPRAGEAQQELRGQTIPEPAILGAGEEDGEAANPPPPAAPAVHAEASASADRAEPVPPGPPAAAAERAPAPAGSRDLAVSMGNVSGVHVFTNADSTSVVISLRGPARVTRGVIAASHHIYFDISAQGAPAAAHAAAAAMLRVGDGRLGSVRVSDNQPGFTRIIIAPEGERVGVGAARFFPNPARLVVSVGAAPARR